MRVGPKYANMIVDQLKHWELTGADVKWRGQTLIAETTSNKEDAALNPGCVIGHVNVVDCLKLVTQNRHKCEKGRERFGNRKNT